jgi:ParB-like chromosome segregation protein Spo0J
MFEVQTISREEIIIEERARQDLGDIETLKADIERMGLLYPIILNESYRLCDGGRRLEALTQLGWEKIPARIIPGLTPEDSLIIEWLGNVGRKDFTWSEEVMLKLRIHESFQAQDSEWGVRATARKLGVAMGGLSSDLNLALSIREFPQLADYSTKGKAKEGYRKISQKIDAMDTFNNLSESEKSQLSEKLGLSAPKEEKSEGASDEPAEQLDDRSVSGGSDQPSASLSVDGERDDRGNSPIPKSNEERLPEHIYEITDFRNLLPSIPDGLIGFAELDPPWAIDFDENYGKRQDLQSDLDDWTTEELYENMTDLLFQLYSKMADSSWILCWTGIEHAMSMNELAQSAGFQTQRPGFWVKPSGQSNNLQTNMVSDYETFLLFRKGKATFNTDYFKACRFHHSVPSAQRWHINQKPFDLYREFFRALYKPDHLFFSPFAGSGASMIVSTFFSMIPVGAELKDKYYYEFIKALKDNSDEASQSYSVKQLISL